MASTNKLNKADKTVDQFEGFTEAGIMANNTDIQETYQSGMNTADKVAIEIPVDGDNTTTWVCT